MHTFTRRFLQSARGLARATRGQRGELPTETGASDVFGGKYEKSRYIPLPSEGKQILPGVAEFLDSPNRSVLSGGDGVFNTETRIYDPYPVPEQYSHFKEVPNPPRDLTKERWNRHRSNIQLGRDRPAIAENSFIAPSATVAGDVLISDSTTVLYGAVLRGDQNHIEVGPFVTIGDNTVVHAAEVLQSGLSAETFISHHVVIGSNCVLRSCSIMPNATIGDNVVICEGAIVEENATVLPNSVVPPGRIIPTGEVWGGKSIAKVRKLDKSEVMAKPILAEDMWNKNGREHRDLFLPVGTHWHQKEIVNEIEETEAAEWRQGWLDARAAENKARADKIKGSK